MDNITRIGIITTIVVIVVIAISAVVFYFILKKESFGDKGVTVDISMDGLVKDVKKDLNAIGIKLKK